MNNYERRRANWLRLFAVLSSTLDLLDLSEPGEKKKSKDKQSPLSSRGDNQKNNSHKKKTDETELIQVEVEQTGPNMRTPERASLDSGKETDQSYNFSQLIIKIDNF